MLYMTGQESRWDAKAESSEKEKSPKRTASSYIYQNELSSAPRYVGTKKHLGTPKEYWHGDRFTEEGPSMDVFSCSWRQAAAVRHGAGKSTRGRHTRSSDTQGSDRGQRNRDRL